MTADVMTPHPVADVRGGGGEIGLEVQRIPCNDCISRKTDRIAVTSGTRVSGKCHRTFSVSSAVQIMIVVQHPQRIQSFHFADSTGLPVYPPEVHALFLLWMEDVTEAGFEKIRIGDIEYDRLFGLWINSQCLSHLRIHFFVCADSVSRMNVQGNMHIPVVEPFHKAFRIREEVTVPCVAGPSAAVFWIDIHQMPVHINDCNGKRKVFFFKLFHQLFVGFFCIFIVAAPPVPECIAGDHGAFPAQMTEVFECLLVIMTVCPEVDVDASAPPGFHPSIVPECEGAAVVHDGEAVPAYNSVIQRDCPVCFIQRAGCSTQIVEILSVVPDAVVRAVIANSLYGQPAGRKGVAVIDQVCSGGDDFQRIVRIDYAERAFGEIAVPHGLRRPVFENPVRIIFEAEQAFCEDRDPPAVSFDNIFRCSLRMSFCDQFWSHI